MKNIITLLAGLIFGLGLIISGMTDPAKVIGFLDVAGLWDPSLMFVMLGGIAVAFVGFKFVQNKSEAIFGDPIHLPGKTHISKELVIGSLLFVFWVAFLKQNLNRCWPLSRLWHANGLRLH